MTRNETIQDGDDWHSQPDFESGAPKKVGGSNPPLGSTTEKVKQLLDSGFSKSEVAKFLKIRPASVTYHTKKLDEAYRQKGSDEHKDWKAIQAYYDEGHTIRQCRDHFGFSMQTWQKAVIRGAVKSRNEKIPLSDYLTQDSIITSSSLKKRLLEEGMLKNVCTTCGQLPEWNGKPLVLQLDHINGNPNDNRLENLRILCGHCHSQTETFCKGFKDKRRKQNFCECGKEIYARSKRCVACANIINRAKKK